MRADVAKALLQEAELCAANRRFKARAEDDELSPAADDPTLARSRDGSGEDGEAQRQAEHAAEPLLPWRDATVGRYHRIF